MTRRPRGRTSRREQAACGEVCARRWRNWSRSKPDPIGATLKAVAQELGVKAGVLVHPTRLACCGNTAARAFTTCWRSWAKNAR